MQAKHGAFPFFPFKRTFYSKSEFSSMV